MALTYMVLIVFMMLSSMVTTSVANKGWNWNYNYGHGHGHGHSHGHGHGHGPFRHGTPKPSFPQNSSKIVVGGSEKWHYGFDYNSWAIKNGPVYLNDTLVFKYDPPSSTSPFAHNVYLLPDIWSYWNCDIKRGKLIANQKQGGGEGFEFVLNLWQPYFFACGERDGLHCNNGTMKFFVVPSFR